MTFCFISLCCVLFMLVHLACFCEHNYILALCTEETKYIYTDQFVQHCLLWNDYPAESEGSVTYFKPGIGVLVDTMQKCFPQCLCSYAHRGLLRQGDIEGEH